MDWADVDSDDEFNIPLPPSTNKNPTQSAWGKNKNPIINKNDSSSIDKKKATGNSSAGFNMTSLKRNDSNQKSNISSTTITTNINDNNIYPVGTTTQYIQGNDSYVSSSISRDYNPKQKLATEQLLDDNQSQGANRWKNFAQKNAKAEEERVAMIRQSGHSRNDSRSGSRGGSYNSFQKERFDNSLDDGGSWRNNKKDSPPRQTHELNRHNSNSSNSSWISGSGGGLFAGKQVRIKQHASSQHGMQQQHTKKKSYPPSSPRSKDKIVIGIITFLPHNKDFGFTQVISELIDSDVFFHFEELSKTGCDPTKLKVGDFVEFVLNEGHGNKSKKFNGTRMKVISKNKIEFDRLLSEDKKDLYGIVLKNQQFRPNRQLGVYKDQRLSLEQLEFLEGRKEERCWEGRILVMSKDKIDQLEEIIPSEKNGGIQNLDKPDNVKCICFSHRDLENKKMPLRRGMVVKFNIVEELASKRIHANLIKIVTKVPNRIKSIIDMLLKKENVEKQIGKVIKLNLEDQNNASGLIDCGIGEQAPIPFEISSLPINLRPNMNNSNRNLKTDNNWRRGDDVVTEKSKVNTVAIGTCLEFVALKHPLNGQLTAFNLKYAEPKEFEEVILCQVKAKVIVTQGMILDSSNDNDDYNNNNIDNENNNADNNNKMTAKKKIESNTKKVAKYHKVVIIKESLKNKKNIPYFIKEAEEKELYLEFSNDDIVSPYVKLSIDDHVYLDIHRYKRTGKLIARAVQLIFPNEEIERLNRSPLDSWFGNCKRETGIVILSKDNHGFIECYDRNLKIYFQQKEVLAIRDLIPTEDFHMRRSIVDKPILKINDLVSFEIDMNYGNNNHFNNNDKHNANFKENDDRHRTAAVRILKINKATPEIVLANKVPGKVVKILAGRSKKQIHNNNNEGLIEFKPSSADSKVLVAPEIWRILSLFSQDKLKKSDDHNKLITQIELIPYISSSSQFEKSSSHSRDKSSTNNSVGDGDSTNDIDVSKDNDDNITFTHKCLKNEHFVAKHYCHFLNLKTELKRKNLNNIIIVRKKQQFNKVKDKKNKRSIESQQKTEKENDDINDKKDDDSKFSLNSPLNLLATFKLQSVVSRAPLRKNDEVEFRLHFDKRKTSHYGDNIIVTGGNDVPINKRRENTETGIIACLNSGKMHSGKKGHSFGFIQSTEYSKRIFFYVTDCDQQLYRFPKAGDEVEFICEKVSGNSNSGRRGGQYSRSKYDKVDNKAVSIRLLNENTLITDVLVKSPETKEIVVFQGTIQREPKNLKEIRHMSNFSSNDHPAALKISSAQLPTHMLGLIIPHNPETGKSQEIDFEDDLNDLDHTATISSSSVFSGHKSNQGTNVAASTISWRREKELVNKVLEFKKGGESIWHVYNEIPNITKEETVLIERQVRRQKLVSNFIGNKLIVARERLELEKMKKVFNINSKNSETETDNNDSDNTEEDDDDDIGLKNRDKKFEKSKNEDNALNHQIKYHMFTVEDLVNTSSFVKNNDDNALHNDNKKYIPDVGDIVEYNLCQSKIDKRIRATNIRLIKPSEAGILYHGIIEGSSTGFAGFVRRIFVDGEVQVEESYKPGRGGRDGSIYFNPKDVIDGIVLQIGDEVEYKLQTNKRTKEVRATKLRLVKRAPQSDRAKVSDKKQKSLNKEAISKMGSVKSAMATVQFHDAKAPDGTPGFPAGRGRNLPIKTKLRVSAKEFVPSF